MQDSDLTTYCGLYCGDCPRFQWKISGLARELLDEFERVHFSDLARVVAAHAPEFRHSDDMIALLNKLLDWKCESTCRQGQDGTGASCEIKKCIRTKAIEGCWACEDFETCGKLDFLKAFCEDAPIKNLRKIKELGIENWAKYREKQYPWL